MAVAAMTAAVCVAAALQPSRICVEEGVATIGNVRVRGALVVGATGQEIRNQVDAELGFVASYTQRIDELTAKSGMDPCALAGILRTLATEKLSAEQLPEALDALFAEHLANLETGKRLTQVDDVAQERIRELNASGEVDRVRSLYGCLGVGIVAGERVEIGGDAILGMPKSELRALVQGMRDQYAEHLAGLHRLSAALHINSCATASFLRKLGEDPPASLDDLPGRLERIALEHLELVRQWRSMTVADPEVKAARDEAKRALDRGDHAGAEALLKHALDVLRKRSDLTKALHSDLARVQGELGHLASIGLRFKEAAELFSKAYTDAESANELSEKIRYKSLEAAAYQDDGRYPEAERAFDQGKALIEPSASGSTAEQGAVLLTNLATLHYAQTKYRDARDEFQAARRAVDALSGLDARALAEWQAICLNGLAQSDLGLSDLQSADEHFAEALRLMETAFGAEAPELAGPTNNLARLRTVQGRFQEAEALYLKAMRLCEGAPADSPIANERSVIRSNLAGLYFETQRYADAEALWGGVLAGYRATLGEEHPLTLGVVQNLAAVKRRLGDLDGAKRLYDEALKPWTSVPEGDRRRPPWHLVAVKLLDGLGDVLVSQNRLDEAAKYYERALDLARKNLEAHQEDELFPDEARQDKTERHLLVAGLRNDLGVVRERQSRLDEAAQQYSKARDVFGDRLGTGHPDYGLASSNLARVLVKLGRLQEAETGYLTAIEVAKANHEDSKVAFRSRMLAELYLMDCRRDEARERLQTARTIYVGLFGEDNAQVRKVSELLASLDPSHCGQ